MDVTHRQVQSTGNSIVASGSHTMVKKLFSFASSLEASKQVTKGTEPRANFETKHNRKAVCTSTPVKSRGRSCTGWPAGSPPVCGVTVTHQRQQQLCSLDKATLFLVPMLPLGDSPSVRLSALQTHIQLRSCGHRGQRAGEKGTAAERPGLATCTCSGRSLWSFPGRAGAKSSSLCI